MGDRCAEGRRVPAVPVVAAVLGLTVALVAAAALPGAARAGYRPGNPPALCAGQAFADQIGTARADELVAARRPERLWGVGGRDVLTGSPTRATCLFGGADADVLTLGAGGGVGFGETGADALTGSALDDVLRGGGGDDQLTAGAGADTVDGGSGRDAIDAGDGDDLIDAADGRAELVDCGAGEDLVAADRLDALVGCESPALAGGASRARGTRPVRAEPDHIVRVSFTAPAPALAGGYRVVLLEAPASDGCLAAGTELTRLPVPGAKVRRGQGVRVGLRPPAAGWCLGAHRAAVVLARPCARRRRCVAPPPVEPVARVAFVVAD